MPASACATLFALPDLNCMLSRVTCQQANVTFSTDGYLLHNASDDAAKQAERRQAAEVAAAAAAAEQERLEVRAIRTVSSSLPPQPLTRCC